VSLERPRLQGAVVELRVYVCPRSSKAGWDGVYGSVLRVRVKAPPVDGKAHLELKKFLEKEWSCFVSIKSTSSRYKKVQIVWDTPSQAQVFLKTLEVWFVELESTI
jgi:hypothetical protein